MAKQEKILWFKAKRYGWGWYPSSWQGWGVTFVYVAAVLYFARTLQDSTPFTEVVKIFLLPVSLVSLLFIIIAYKTGEKPMFRWGTKKK